MEEAVGGQNHYKFGDHVTLRRDWVPILLPYPVLDPRACVCVAVPYHNAYVPWIVRAIRQAEG